MSISARTDDMIREAGLMKIQKNSKNKEGECTPVNLEFKEATKQFCEDCFCYPQEENPLGQNLQEDHEDMINILFFYVS